MRRLLTIALLAGALGMTSVNAASAAQIFSDSGSITAEDPTQTDRLALIDPPDTCASNDGTSALGGAASHHRDLYDFVNATNDAVCITVTIDPLTCVGATALGSGAYVPSLNPAAVAENAVADIGAAPAASKSYSFSAPPGGFEISVHEADPDAFCAGYEISVDSLQPFATARPLVSGVVAVGSTLTGITGTWTGTPSLTHQWRRCNASGGSCVDMPGATSATYAPTAADRGATLRNRVTATEAGQTSVADSPPSGAIGVPFSTSTGAIGPGDPTQSPRLFRDGEPSTCAASEAPTATGAGSFRYDLYSVENITNGPLCVSVALNGITCSGATGIFSAAYVPSFSPAAILANGVGDGGSSPGAAPIRSYSFSAPPGASTVNVHEVNAGAGCPAYGLTLASVQPFATAAPAISGAAAVDGTLTAAPGTWTGGPAITHQWRRCDASGGACADITGATAATYEPTAADLGATLRDRVGAIEAGQTSSADSAPTGPVAPSAPTPDTDPPQTTITEEPKNKLKTSKKRKRARYEFKSDEAGSTFRCKVDTKPFLPCASPLAFKATLGKHTVRIVATDAAGNPDPSPAGDRFKVRPK